MKHYLSLGAGVQSSTIALMAEHGEITPTPEAAIFADTQAEPESVYRWLDWLEKQLSFPVIRVTRGSLEKAGIEMRTSEKGGLYSKTDIPFFTKSQDGEIGKIRNRSCTADYKIAPITKCVRKLAAVKRGEKTLAVCQWIGISLDEIQRVKPAREPWIQSRWPLIEKRMRRGDCIEWMRKHGYPTPPRSSCVFCPYHNNKEWRRLQLEEPEEFQRAVQFERDIQSAKTASGNFSSIPYLHRSCKPLNEIDFRSDIERGQMELDFQDECFGMCGV